MVARDRREKMRLSLPYGRYMLEEGKGFVLFNRRYQPMWHVADDRTRTQMDPKHWVDGIVGNEYFFNDGNCPWYSGPRCRASLRRVTEILAGRDITREDTEGWKRV